MADSRVHLVQVLWTTSYASYRRLDVSSPRLQVGSISPHHLGHTDYFRDPFEIQVSTRLHDETIEIPCDLLLAQLSMLFSLQSTLESSAVQQDDPWLAGSNEGTRLVGVFRFTAMRQK